jgi:localization factor PodJL
MSGTSDDTRGRTGFPLHRAGLLAGASIVAVAAAGLVAFVTIDAQPLPTLQGRKPVAAMPQDPPSDQQAPPFANDLAVPLPKVPAPPTAADVEAAVPAGSTPAQAPPASPPSPAAASGNPRPADDPASLPIEALRAQANQNHPAAMVELARRLIVGAGIAKDQQAGAGWMLRAAELGSPMAAFDVGVMYESGFVVERSAAHAAQWYRRAANAGVPAAQHNLALLLRAGKGVPRDGAEAVKLLHEAAQKGMTASMFALGDIYEQGDAAPRDSAAAAAWFAITAQFERQASNGKETQLGKTALERSQAIQRVLTPADLQRARELGEREIRDIVQAMAPAQSGVLPSPALPSATDSGSASAPSRAPDPAAGWPSDASGQVRAIQQALLDLGLLKDRPDGALGPVTRHAIRNFQRTAGLAQTGDPTKETYVALRTAIARRDATTPGVGLPAATLPPPPASGGTP